ncbi:hypothetical protein GGR54DRAFT_59112 [Hypoxylon sp. NC1633]|nr:hypothetical protein GGR54DRAFT_59112 [Hypoxylon sp. NC1633]
MFFAVLFTIAPVLGAQVLLPALTGPHNIGLRNLELVDHGRVDPFSPTGAPRDLMVTLLYPTTKKSLEHLPLAPQFSPAAASYFDGWFSWPSGTAASLTTRARLDAPLTVETARAPVLLFSHGFGSLGFTRSVYTALLSDLASWGWVVATVDHPYDSGVVEYPDGRVVPARNWSWPLDLPTIELAINTRVADLLFVLGQLGDASVMGRLTEGPHVQHRVLGHDESGAIAPIFNTSRVVALGHSFGGATAVGASFNSSAIVAATDLDGFLYGPAVQEGTDKLVLVLGFLEHYATDDPNGTAGWPALHGWKRDFTVAGTVHTSYSDYVVFGDILGAEGPSAGTVPATRMVQILRTYVDAFFSKFLLGVDDGGFLSTNSSAFPEVLLRRWGP